MSRLPHGRGELWWLTVAAVAAVLAVLRPDLYAAAVRHLITAAIGHR
ncbi:hypothetical protein [Streptomyces roseochromogenus]|uniref:Uncharacterized protein n=1 Tax=Streptomyces roseochromogenus subsp. oscitans DS 12.976 TaxID=1352936 RepID=V6KWS5_STRRC|nr:hypothetical protein [Streptomyces roseochromogenus]EST36478.1 hypothetical protein M878_01980 [Streptomyces roseochromogenus subsp. oscitans DS 12.976]